MENDWKTLAKMKSTLANLFQKLLGNINAKRDKSRAENIIQRRNYIYIRDFKIQFNEYALQVQF